MPNTLYYGDNLDILRNQISSASVDLIYLDPPFASAHTPAFFTSTDESHTTRGHVKALPVEGNWDSGTSALYNQLVTKAEPHIQEIIATLYSLFGESIFMAFLVGMTARLIELHRVLKPSGSLFLHCASSSNHYLRLLLDAIFDPNNFRNEIIWQHHRTRNDATAFANAFDTILFYSKSHDPIINTRLFVPALSDNSRYYNHDDNDGRGVYRLNDLSNPYLRPNLVYEWYGYTPPAKGWRYNRERMRQLHDERRIYYPLRPDGTYDTSRRPALKQYLNEQPGPLMSDMWTDILPPIDNMISRDYSFQKPLPLLERIIKAASQPGAICLDPFMGLGTTLLAAQLLERQWIGIDKSHIALALTKMRLHSEFSGLAIETVGEPRDLQAARHLAAISHEEFRWWVIGVLAEQIPSIVLSSRGNLRHDDRGFDYIFEVKKDDPQTPQRVAARIKIDHIRVGEIHELLDNADHEKARMVVLVTLEEPPSAVTHEARKHYPQLQLLTIADLLGGARIQIPSELDYSVGAAKSVLTTTPTSLTSTSQAYLSTEQAAKILGVAQVTVRLWCANNKFEGAVQQGREWKIPIPSVENFARPRRGRPKQS